MSIPTVNYPLNPLAKTAGRIAASAFGQYSATLQNTQAAGSNVLLNLFVSPVVAASDGTPFTPFATNSSLTIGFGLANAETVTPSAVSYTAFPGGVQVTVTTANAHNAGETIVSGSFGLQEAINVANNAGGGVVLIDQSYLGSAAQVNAVTGNATVTLEDIRTGINARPSVVALNAQAAVPVASGFYLITKGSAGAYTLAAPVAGQDDGKYICVVASTAFAHTVTTPANKINGTLHVATFAATIGNNVEFLAYQGVWYVILPSTGVTLT
jgi:hypothetical protein